MRSHLFIPVARDFDHSGTKGRDWRHRGLAGLAWLLLACVLTPPSRATAAPAVRVVRLPAGGIQPQAVADAQGVAHVVFFKGEPMAGDLFYARWDPRQGRLEPPRQVNHRLRSAVAVGTMRGAQLAVGRRGRVHVVWNGSGEAKADGHEGAPLLYTRLDETGNGFEPERDVITRTAALDGGGSVAADAAGNVLVAWHASPEPGALGEADRAVFAAWSSDDGRTFAPERKAVVQDLGACACCGLDVAADAGGAFYLLYRIALNATNRAMAFAVAPRAGADFRVVERDPWAIATCPASTTSVRPAGAGVLAAWQTEDRVSFTRFSHGTEGALAPVLAPGVGLLRKHPVAVANARGETLLVWTEGTGWERGGTLAWQLFDHGGQPVGPQGRAEDVPVWGLATAFAQPDGSFVVIY